MGWPRARRYAAWAVTPLDWILVAFTVLMAAWGYAQGLIVGALSLAGFAGRGAARLAPGAAGAGAGLGLAVRAAERADRRRPDRRHARFRPGGARLPPARSPGRGPGRARRARRCAASRLPGTGAGLDLRRRGAADARGARAARADPALGDPARAERAPAAVGADPEGARALRPAASDRRSDGGRAAARARASPATPRCARPAAASCACSGTACGLGVQGSGWVAGDGIVVTNAHVVAGQDDTTVQVGGEGPIADAEAIWFDPRNDLAILRAPDLAGVPALGLRTDAPPGDLGRDPRLPAQRPLRRAPGSPRRDLRRSVPRTPTAAARCCGGSPRSAGWCARATPAGRWSTARAAWSRPCSRPRSATAVGTGSACPTRSSGAALRRAGGPVDTGPCAR